MKGSTVLLLSISLIVSLFLLLGTKEVPFHPDESSMLYQSRDLEKLFSDPSSLGWDQDRVGQQNQTYRLLNPPIPKYIIALGRLLGGYDHQTVNHDWNWSASWDENVAASAMPEQDLLRGARIATTVVLSLALVLLILISRRLSGDTLALMSILLFALHSLVLLHGRRAMSEGPLLFGIYLAILGILKGEQRPWLTGLGTAVAASSKLSAAALFPVGLIAVLWRRPSEMGNVGKQLRGLFLFALAAIVVTLALNPVLWSHPVQGIREIWNSRVEFTIRQVETIRTVSPDHVLETPGRRISGMLVMLFFRPPQTSEVANYVTQLGANEEAYLDRPIHQLSSGWLRGGIVFLVTLFGLTVSILQCRRAPWKGRRDIGLLFLATMLQAVALLLAISIPFQRYYLPLVPFIILWMGLGLLHLGRLMKKAVSLMDGFVL